MHSKGHCRLTLQARNKCTSTLQTHYREQMLMNLHREQWTQGLVMKRFEDHQASNEKTVEVSERAERRVEAEPSRLLSPCGLTRSCARTHTFRCIHACYFNLWLMRRVLEIVLLVNGDNERTGLRGC